MGNLETLLSSQKTAKAAAAEKDVSPSTTVASSTSAPAAHSVKKNDEIVRTLASLEAANLEMLRLEGEKQKLEQIIGKIVNSGEGNELFEQTEKLRVLKQTIETKMGEIDGLRANYLFQISGKTLKFSSIKGKTLDEITHLISIAPI